MDIKQYEEIKTISRKKNGGVIVGFSAVVFLLIAVIVFFSVLRICESIRMKNVDEYFYKIPEVTENNKNGMLTYSNVYNDDILARAEIGLKLYSEKNAMTDAEELEWVRNAVSADSVSLVDENGQVLATTGPASPEETFNACVKSLEPRSPHLEFY
ncbi:MAG: hypothetical protein Q4G47_05730, partial [Lachnospiraceae bacterium]|nr:hypothetical protein [Lachnospiraceae bacterium]